MSVRGHERKGPAMHLIITAEDQARDAQTMRAMFAARKRVFVDLLRWDIPVLEDRYEIDQFDDARARYLILVDEEGRHCGSTRLLATVEDHILGDLFPELCEGPVPTGPTIYEITRFCLDPRQAAAARRVTRNRLVSALAEYALANGVSDYTGVAALDWFQQILAFGWECEPLGLPRGRGGTALIALRIRITPNIVERVKSAGCYVPTRSLTTATIRAAA